MNSIYICWWGVSCLLSKFVHSSLLPSVAPSPPVPPLLIFISCPSSVPTPGRLAKVGVFGEPYGLSGLLGWHLVQGHLCLICQVACDLSIAKLNLVAGKTPVSEVG